MTLHDIEQTITTLRARHINLSEDLLVTLLTSGGWEASSIKDAVALFRGGNATQAPKAVTQPVPVLEKLFVPLIEDPALPREVEPDHMLLAHNEEHTVIEEKQSPIPDIAREEESLIQEVEHPTRVSSVSAEPPHDLPLLPFDSSPHVWPFARYKEVFHGNVMPDANPPVVAVSPKEEIKVENVRPSIAVPQIRTARSVTSKKDDSLVAIACVSLFVVLLLLGYMYSLGRI